MPDDDLILRRAVVTASGVIYWAGVFVQARRIRRHIGHSPNVRPRTPKEKILWLGWFLVILGWIGQPVAIHTGALGWFAQISPALVNPLTLALGIILIAGGYAATLWCYAIMGDAWRMGINQKEKNSLITRGPYGRVRHPIYLFQIVMLAGAALLLPTPLSLAVLLVHVVCVLIKAVDEETYLLGVHGDDYRNYMSRTGRLMPRIF